MEVYDEGPAKDSNDPNYDSAEEVEFYHIRNVVTIFITGGLCGYSNTA